MLQSPCESLGVSVCEVVNEFTCETKSSCDPAVWRQSPADQCDNSPCDFCCTSHEMMAAGGICPVPLDADANVNKPGCRMEYVGHSLESDVRLTICRMVWSKGERIERTSSKQVNGCRGRVGKYFIKVPHDEFHDDSVLRDIPLCRLICFGFGAS